MPFVIGTSGWQYADWKGRFYPAGCPTRAWLDHYRTVFPMVEVNNTFYRLPERSTFERWARQAPDLEFVIKASRYLTHIRRLSEPEAAVERLLERAEPLLPQMGPVLVQLPPTLRFDAARLAGTLDAFPSTMRVAVEPRHESWFVDAMYDLLRAHDAALCLVDRRGPKAPMVRTSSWGYVRLHQGRGASTSYGAHALESWAERLCSLFPDDAARVYVAFNNDPGASAPANARTLMRLLDARGRTVVPPSAVQEAPHHP